MHHTIRVNGLKMHYVEAGEGPPVVLLHGFPETWYCWRHQIPELRLRYRLIVPDLRGYGETEKPTGGYDKRTMANDVVALMQHCGISKAAIVGHDRGARVATRLAKDHPGMVERLVVMDNVPTRIIFERMNAEIARGHWFFIFNNVPDLPEALITGREEVWLRFIFSSWCYNPELFTPEEIAVYLRAYSQPGALRGAFSDYRAGREDVAQDEADKDVLIQCPTLALWGEEFALGGKMWDFREIWSKMASRMEYFSIPECGHLPHEEKPEVVTGELLRFLEPWRG
jgi:pimeloyl-ACP methyl ester carboxylesterase